MFDQQLDLDNIPKDFFELAAKAATRALEISGITGIYFEAVILKEQMNIIQHTKQNNK